MLNGRLRTFEAGPRGAVGASPTRNRTGRKFHSFFSARVQRALVAFRTVPTRSSRTHFLFDGRFALSRFGLGGASTSVGRVTYRVACHRETGTSDAVGLTRVAVRAGDAAAHRTMHNDARVVRENVETWQACWPGTPAAGLGTKGGHEGLVGSNCLTRLSFYPYGSWGRDMSSRSAAAAPSGNPRTVRPHGHAQLRAFSTTRSESS